MLSGGGPGLQSREGGRAVPGGFDSHPFRLRASLPIYLDYTTVVSFRSLPQRFLPRSTDSLRLRSSHIMIGLDFRAAPVTLK